MSTLVEQLGYDPGDRLVIITSDDLGMCHATNLGVYESMREGAATSSSLMVPCPWARDAAARYLGEDVGVQLTVNAEHELYRWGPITQAPSLLDGDGGFPRTVEDLWDHADLDEIRKEALAQVERAILWGFDVSHLSAHLGALLRRPEFFDVYLSLAVDLGLPVRLGGAAAEASVGFPFRRLAAEEGVVSPDHLVQAGPAASRRSLERALFELEPGVTELVVRPAADTSELRAMAGDWAARVDDLHYLTHEGELRALLERSGAVLVGYRELRDLQRAGATRP